jgi:hypothetical protein
LAIGFFDLAVEHIFNFLERLYTSPLNGYENVGRLRILHLLLAESYRLLPFRLVNVEVSIPGVSATAFREFCNNSSNRDNRELTLDSPIDRFAENIMRSTLAFPDDTEAERISFTNLLELLLDLDRTAQVLSLITEGTMRQKPQGIYSDLPDMLSRSCSFESNLERR